MPRGIRGCLGVPGNGLVNIPTYEFYSEMDESEHVCSLCSHVHALGALSCPAQCTALTHVLQHSFQVWPGQSQAQVQAWYQAADRDLKRKVVHTLLPHRLISALGGDPDLLIDKIPSHRKAKLDNLLKVQ